MLVHPSPVRGGLGSDKAEFYAGLMPDTDYLEDSRFTDPVPAKEVCPHKSDVTPWI